MIDLQTAQALGLTIPQSSAPAADQVIERVDDLRLTEVGSHAPRMFQIKPAVTS